MAKISTLIFTPFGELELTNAIEQRIFRGEINLGEAQMAGREFQSDIQNGILGLHTLPAAVYGKAVQLSKKHTAAMGNRALDILHVAAALVLGAKEFATFDANQSKLAKTENLTVRL